MQLTREWLLAEAKREAATAVRCNVKARTAKTASERAQWAASWVRADERRFLLEQLAEKVDEPS